MRSASKRRTLLPAGIAGALLTAALLFPDGRIASAQPSPLAPTPTPSGTGLVPDLIPEDEESPSPSPSNKPGGGKEEEPDKGKRDGKGDGEGRGGKDRGGRKDGRASDGRRRGGRGSSGSIMITPRIPGAYDTTLLNSAAARLRALGWNEQDVIRHVYPPFIIAGDAVWVDTWGAPRYGPGPLVRTHEGQDVFCDLGDPVLASQDGVVEFVEGGLGGRVARLHRPQGGYWYYAHLADWNTDDFPNGGPVEAGDVIGYCGNTGNAVTTAPHVHFGWYGPGNIALDPMESLISWLRAAEARATATVARAAGERVERITQLTTQRRFGDSYAPDRSRLMDPGESLWAAGSAPSVGMFGVAQVALQEAMSQVPLPAFTSSSGEPSSSAYLEEETTRDLSLWLFQGGAGAGAASD